NRSRMDLGGDESNRDQIFKSLIYVDRLPGGETLVVDEWTIKIFDASGRLVRSFGGRGEGPGQFALNPSIAVAGDSIVTFDGYRAAVFERATTRVVSDTRLAPPLEPGCLTIGAIDATWLRSGHWVIGTLLRAMTPPATTKLEVDSIVLRTTG